MLYLEDVEGFVLHHPPVVFQLPHDKLQVITRIDISRHDLVELPIQKYLAKKFDGLSFRDIAVALNKNIVVFVEEQFEVRTDVLRNQLLVFRKEKPEAVESICRDLKRRLVDPIEELPENTLAGTLLRDIDVVVDVNGFAVW